MFDEKILTATSTTVDGNMSFRFGDEESVVENRQRFLEKNGIAFQNHICMKCNHGMHLVAVTRESDGIGAKTQEKMIEAEVLATNEKGLALMLLTADCIPATFYDPEHEAIALAHLNRHTIAHSLAQKTVRFLRETYDTDPTKLLVHFGPHIKKESYRYPLPLPDPTPPQLAPFVHKESSAAVIDMTAAHKAELINEGVPERNIEISPVDTGTSPEHFSYYRSKHDPTSPNGRLATIAMLLSTDEI